MWVQIYNTPRKEKSKIQSQQNEESAKHGNPEAVGEMSEGPIKETSEINSSILPILISWTFYTHIVVQVHYVPGTNHHPFSGAKQVRFEQNLSKKLQRCV